MAKITESQLRSIIKQELENIIKENDGYETFKQAPRTSGTSLTNNQFAVLAAIGELMEEGSDILGNQIKGYYIDIANRSNGMVEVVDNKELGNILNNLLNQNFIEIDKIGEKKVYFTTEKGDEVLASNTNHPVNKLLFK